MTHSQLTAIRRVYTALATLTLTLLLLYCFGMFHHALPLLRGSADGNASSAGVPVAGYQTALSGTGEASLVDPRTDWQKRFADHFTEETQIGEYSCFSPTLSFQVTKHTEGTGDNTVTYFVADVYIADPSQLRGDFAGGEMQIGYGELMEDMSEELGALLSVNGDNCVQQNSMETTVTLRNGILYRRGERSLSDIMVRFPDGSIETFRPGTYELDELLARGATDIWHFGPMLIDENGNEPENMTANYKGIASRNPRTAFGYFEPGHYCLVVVDGRSKGYSRGMTLSELSELMRSLGCVRAYNLDGGGTSAMYCNGSKINRQSVYRKTGDIIYFTELTQ